MTTPISICASAATRPTVSETRAPTQTWSQMSRPSASVPNQCSQEGGW